MDSRSYAEAQKSFAIAERCLDRSCDQMEILLSKIDFLETRLNQALANENEAVARNVNLELDVLHGVYDMYYKYSEIKANQLMALSEQLSLKKA